MDTRKSTCANLTGDELINELIANAETKAREEFAVDAFDGGVADSLRRAAHAQERVEELLRRLA